jgi:hypothetical protein
MRRLFCTILFTALGLASAGAVDFHAQIKNLDGSSIPVSPTDPAPLTLGRVAQDVLIANNLPGDTATPDEKARRFWLAMKIHDGTQTLTAEEIAMLKRVIGLGYGPLIIGRTTELLDPAGVPKP